MVRSVTVFDESIPFGFYGLQIMVRKHELTSSETWLAVHGGLVEESTDTSFAESIHCRLGVVDAFWRMV
jgi:hypothetical protein